MLTALIVTIVVEGVVMYCLTHSLQWVRNNIYCNMVTNPILNFTLLGLGILFQDITNPVLNAIVTYFAPLIIMEAFVFWGEGRLYNLMTHEPLNRCYRLSIITNAFSMTAGLIMTILFYIV